MQIRWEGNTQRVAGPSTPDACLSLMLTSTVRLPLNAARSSEDELGMEGVDMATQAAAAQQFEQRLRQRGLVLKRMLEDGNCLFRCVADRVYGDAEVGEHSP